MFPDFLLPFSDGWAFLVVLLAGGFVKCFTTLQIFRVGIGLYGSAVGVLILIFSTVFSLFVVQAVLPGSGSSGEVSPTSQATTATGSTSSNIVEQVKPLLESRTSDKMLAQLSQFEERIQKKFQVSSKASDDSVAGKEGSSSALLMAFLLEELNEAFQLGLLFIIPFIVIDLLVIHILQLLQISQIPAIGFALPLKLLLFLAADGWSLLTGRLIGSYLA